jgi:hypothetical protein
MAETLTVDPNPPAEIVGEQDGIQLTADEQDSLAVGEQMVEQQEKLLAGKYKDAEELEKAYINLQKKLGEDGQEENKAEAEQEEVLPEESEESTEEFSEAAQVISSAAEEFEANDGQITQETYDQLSSMSSADLVQAYMEVQSSVDPEAAEAPDISDAEVNEIKNSFGGEEAYGQVTEWASNNLDQGTIQAFDNIVNNGDMDTIRLAVAGLRAQYENANGYEGRMVTGKAPVQSKDAFRSQAELVRAMSDPKYDKDPAYRQDVMAKLERSGNLQF